ncbi:MAG: hypothetical protein IKP65_02005 [Alphaproteobacteria bacterium]|nr:hypothetical protein [Alphaproteobacteria bacterium]
MSVIQFNEEGELSINVKTDVTLSNNELEKVEAFFREFRENIYDFDTNEEFVEAGMKKLAKKMGFKYEILSGPDFVIEI